MIEKNANIFVAGHRGLAGSAIVRSLKNHGYTNILTKMHKELDLMDQSSVRIFFKNQKIDIIIIAAAKVGGILANNNYPAEFIYNNLMIESNIIHEAYNNGVQHIIFLGSSCIYPKNCNQPIKEEYLLTGLLEATNEPYAIAKIAGIKLCESYNRQYGTNYRSIMPNNLYGINDNFDLQNSHVLPALIRKFHLAKLKSLGNEEKIKTDEKTFGPIREEISGSYVKVWGTGSPRREFLYVDDIADACVFLMNLDNDAYKKFTLPMCSHVNVGTGVDITIKELSEIISSIVGFKGDIIFDITKPDGTPQKLLDVSRLNSLGWKATISIEEGIKKVYKWYVEKC
ncbi:MAG: GDP-L-fucose synthase [Desulfobacterales bacterium]|nr:GDP-L-fucose synthase [Desulfobacterales bacterium]